VLDEAIRELTATLEELRVAEEELRQQNETLRESQESLGGERERYRSLFNFAPDAYLVTDLDGTIEEANAAAGDLLGRVPHHLHGKPLSVMIPPERHRDFRNLMLGLASEAATTTWEFEVAGPRSAPVPVEGRVQAFTHEGRVALRWLLRDLTERRSAQEALRRANADLEARVAERTAALLAANETLLAREREREALVAELRASEVRLTEQKRELARSNDDLRDFAYVASHDLKEPLRGISNYAGFLLDDCGEAIGPAGREKLEVMQRLAKRLHDLLDSLLEYSRAGRMDLCWEQVPLGELVEEITDSLHPWLKEHNAEVRVGRLPTVSCDRARISEVLSNLIVNAVKYNEADCRTVDVQRLPAESPGFERIMVRDNGIGIDTRHAEAIFKMFRRLHPRDRFGGGTGAGLAIVRKIVERHGGRIWVDNIPGPGSTFQLELPASGRVGHRSVASTRA
jgi:PAS domain S-box-containing protein